MEWCDDDDDDDDDYTARRDDDDYTARRDDGRVGIVGSSAVRVGFTVGSVSLSVSVSSETERVWCGDHESIQSNRIEAARFRIDRVKDDGDATCDGLVSVGCGRRRA